MATDDQDRSAAYDYDRPHWVQFCPLDNSRLIGQERVVEERVPSTVPEHLPREQQAIYRRTDRYEIVECAKSGHRFKRTHSTLKGMAA